MKLEIIYFLIAFVLPFLYFRTLLFAATKIFDKPFLREKTGLKIHHIHYGMVLMLIAVFLLILLGQNKFIIGLFGFSLGFMYDEFIPALLMKSNRKDEMSAYRKSFIPTLILFSIIILILIFLAFI